MPIAFPVMSMVTRYVTCGSYLACFRASEKPTCVLAPRYYIVQQEQGKVKMPRSAAPESLEVPPAEVEVNEHDKIPMPSEETDEMDEMDAAEVAQFKADVQGHRHQEVLTYPALKNPAV